jgi:hypothetical protein
MVTPPILSDFPAAGILWQKWEETTEAELARRNRPVLLFVADPDPVVFPFLRAIFEAMPKNERLRHLLHAEFPALYVESRSTPEALSAYGAGSRYHIAILSPHGLNPMVVFDITVGDPTALVTELVAVLERLLPVWQ